MPDFPEWQHKFVSTRACPTAGYGPTAHITVEAGLHHLAGNARPHFSVTAEIFIHGRRDCEACGCLHRAVLKYWPVLKPVVDLHLSDDRGEPMHGISNGWYNLAGYYLGAGERYHRGNSSMQHWKDDGTFDRYGLPTPLECLAMFADDVRIPLDQARALACDWECRDDWKSTKRWFEVWYRTQLPRFRQEANAACALLDTLIADQKAAVQP